jgi:hypothetical protein
VRVSQPVTANSDVILRLPGLPQIPGKVLHDGEEFGVRFTWQDDEAPVELCEWLDQRSAA